MKIGIGCIYNNEEILQNNLLSTTEIFDKHFCVISDPPSAAEGLNKIIIHAYKCNWDVLVMVHQDVQLPMGWIDRLRKTIQSIDKLWGVLGVWGIDSTGTHHGNIHDGRFSFSMTTDDLPVIAAALDECCLILNMHTRFSFDESYRGFDLYGTYICNFMKMNGYYSYIIDAPLKHNCKRSFTFTPDEIFLSNWDKLKDTFGSPIFCTVYEEPDMLGVVNE